MLSATSVAHTVASAFTSAITRAGAFSITGAHAIATSCTVSTIPNSVACVHVISRIAGTVAASVPIAAAIAGTVPVSVPIATSGAVTASVSIATTGAVAVSIPIPISIIHTVTVSIAVTITITTATLAIGFFRGRRCAVIAGLQLIEQVS